MAKSLEIKIIKESGYLEALRGMMFSYETECPLDEIEEIETPLDIKRAKTVAKNLAPKGKGHNKFLEHITVTMDVRAGLDWWKQMDTYRIGMSKQSKSTMHTIMRKPIVPEDFDDLVDPDTLEIVEGHRLAGDFRRVSKNLPQGFLQTRRITTNYKSIGWFIEQRIGHKLFEWDILINELKNKLEHFEFIINNKYISNI